MAQVTKLKSICRRENVQLEVIKPPGYIVPFLLHCEEEIILIRKEGSMPAPFIPLINAKEDTHEEFELTGSPLHTSLDDSLINSPLTEAQVKINEYYNHSPLSVDQALQIINLFTLSGNPSFEEKELPVWLLCDASDVSQTVLLTLWRRDDGWMVRGNVTLAPSHFFLQNFNPSLDAMLKEHLQLSRAQKNDVSYQVKAYYNCKKNEASNIVDEFADNGSSLKMHLSWKRPHSHFGFPPYDAVSHMEASATVGCECSSLWQEIEKLQEISGLMDSNPVERENHSLLSMATMNLTVMTSSLRCQVHSYVCAGKLPPSFSSSKAPGAPKNGVGHVLDICEEVAEGRRNNMDLTEVLWSILKDCNDLVELNSCFKMIIREAASGRFTPKILPDNKTSIAKIIKGSQDILQTMSIKLRGSEAIQFMWELGLLKLQRDYKSILQRLELMPSELSDAFNEQASSPKITKQQREEGIEHLVAVHCFIEILILLKSQLRIDNESLYLLVMSAVSKITSSVLEFAKSSTSKSPDCNYMDSGLQKMDLSVHLQPKISIPLIKGCNPESWSFNMSTVESDRKTVTIFHENTDGLFPPEINDKGNKSESKGNLIVKFSLLSSLLFRRG